MPPKTPKRLFLAGATPKSYVELSLHRQNKELTTNVVFEKRDSAFCGLQHPQLATHQ